MRTIEVVGSGEVEAVADQVTLRLGIEVSRPDQEAAVTAVTEQAGRLHELLDRYEVAAADRRTVETAVHPGYDDRGSRVVRQVARYGMTVLLRDVAASGRLLAEAAGAVGSGFQVGGVAWSVGDRAAIEAEARAKAVADAAERARQLAGAAGVELGPLQSIVEPAEDRGGPSPIVLQSARSMAAELGPDVPMEPGQERVTVMVRLTYAITGEPGGPATSPP